MGSETSWGSPCSSVTRTAGTSSMPSTCSQTSVVSSSVSHEATKISSDDPRVTFMMKDIPVDYTRDQLLEIMDSAGFQKEYTVVYLPTELKGEEVLGYAFITFTTHEQAEKFKAHFHNFTDWQVPSDEVCEVFWSDGLQGYDATIERCRNSPVMHESVPDKFRPALYKNGVRVPFPNPTKFIKAPRPRTRGRTLKVAC